MIITITCWKCGKQPPFIEVDAKDYQSWRNGELIQKAMPNLSPQNRELLISQTCDDCFKEMFADESDEDPGGDPEPIILA